MAELGLQFLGLAGDPEPAVLLRPTPAAVG